MVRKKNTHASTFITHTNIFYRDKEASKWAMFKDKESDCDGGGPMYATK